MTTKKGPAQQLNTRAVILRMLLGAAIGFAIISVFVFSVDNPNPDWGKFWRIRPLIITPLAGAFGILSFYLTNLIRPQGQFMTVLIYTFSTIAFIIALWLGTVLGLAGTLWD
jgi:hypothetical protein